MSHAQSKKGQHRTDALGKHGTWGNAEAAARDAAQAIAAPGSLGSTLPTSGTSSISTDADASDDIEVPIPALGAQLVRPQLPLADRHQPRRASHRPQHPCAEPPTNRRQLEELMALENFGHALITRSMAGD